MPSIGRLVRYRTPEEGSQVRLDNGVYEGGEISMFYDPMIAKVTTWDRNRPAAVALMRRALDEFYIKGVQHNIAFLTALMANPRFLDGRLSTNFIAEEYPNGFSPAPLEEKDVNAIVAAGFLMYVRHLYRASHVSSQMPGYHRKIPVDWEVTVNGKVYPVKLMGLVEGGPEAGFEIMVEDALIAVRSDWQVGDHVLRSEVNGIPQRFKVEPSGLGFKLFHLGAEVEVVIHRKTVADLLKLMPQRKAPDMSRYLVSPMPGLLRSISAEVGDKVEPGVELAVVEAMKMENILRSACTGRITKVHAKAGDTLAVGQVIVEFE
jgi:propionyl-CoA carboxylase alpha chain